MAKSFRVLYVASEIKPFLNETYVSEIVRKLPQEMQEKGVEIRILVPRFGLINERKNRLHEVVILSGLNISISCSLSVNNLNATDWTLPADLEPGNLVHNIGEMLNPTK